MLAAMLLGRAVNAQTVPQAPDDNPSTAAPSPTPPVIFVPGPRGVAPPPSTNPSQTPAPTTTAPPAAVVLPSTGAPPAPGAVALPPPPPPPEGMAVPPALPPPPPGASTAGAGPALAVPGTSWPVAAPGQHPALTRERLRLLDTSIIPLAERSHDARIIEGILGLVVGGALVTLGFVLQPSGGGGDAVGFNSLLWLSGGYSLLGGALQLFWVPARERLAAEYQAMPRATAADRRAQVRFGERSLDEMAADGNRRRVLSALANVGLTLATLALIYHQQIFSGQPWPDPPVANYLIIGVSGISVITSLIGLLGRSEEERLRDTYRRELTNLRQIPITNE